MFLKQTISSYFNVFPRAESQADLFIFCQIWKRYTIEHNKRNIQNKENNKYGKRNGKKVGMTFTNANHLITKI